MCFETNKQAGKLFHGRHATNNWSELSCSNTEMGLARMVSENLGIKDWLSCWKSQQNTKDTL